jgi:hypothetical protein
VRPEPRCPFCSGPMPPATTGRPRTFCTATCAQRARSRRRQAAQLLEYAASYEQHIGDSAFGSVDHIAGRVRELREQTAELVAGFA